MNEVMKKTTKKVSDPLNFLVLGINDDYAGFDVGVKRK